MVRNWLRLTIGLGLVALAVAAAMVLRPSMPTMNATADSLIVPAPAVDEPAPTAGEIKTAVFAGGCFWGVQGVFQHVNGVTEAESGYAGGDPESAHYDAVSTGSTGHAESVRVTYDPTQVSYGQLLRIFFSVVQDPTLLNRQGPDHGTQYRSAIFAEDEVQRNVAEGYIAQLSQAGVFSGSIVTTVSPRAEFYPAEAYHQDFLNSNPTYPYIAMNDMPKVNELKQLFPDLYREQPVLVLTGGR
jgi:peptide-methionine (S)-S-oxide reductase